MGLRGKRPAPTALKLLNGETRPSRVNYSEPELPAPANIDPPPTLSGAGRAEWNRLIGPLIRAGVLTDGDMTVFLNYCLALEALRRAERKVGRMRLETAIASGLHNATVKLRAQVSQLQAQLGLTPSSRSAVVKAARAANSSKLDLFVLRGRRRG